MGWPKRALRHSQLVYVTAGTAGKEGSHQTYRVTFIEDGVEKPAFFKKLAPQKDYPELLAKIDVGIAAFKNLFQGHKSAAQRLVLDDDKKVVGIASITIDGFEAIAKSAPSFETLLFKKIIEVLFGRWFLDDDDSHPYNLGFAGDNAVDIDFDMCMYWFTQYMKNFIDSARPGIVVTKERVSLTVKDWERFPIIEDSQLYHWPANRYPGEHSEFPPGTATMSTTALSLVAPKPYTDPEQIRRLASSSEAHEQKFAIALKALLTFHPERIRKYLYALFGDISLNYTSLDETGVALRALYEEKFPLLCNSDTNKEPFIDFMIKLYQKHYDNLYRIVVFYMGCENNGYGLALPATRTALYNKPSYYKNVKESVEQQLISEGEDAESVQNSLIELDKRYHQIWRDASAPKLNDLLNRVYTLTFDILRSTCSPPPEYITSCGKEIDDEDFTDSLQRFNTFPILSRAEIEPTISVETTHSLRKAALLLIEFATKLDEARKEYYGITRESLTEEHNLQFSRALKILELDGYVLQISQSLSWTTSAANEFSVIATELDAFATQVNFQMHLLKTDQQMLSSSEEELLPCTHERVVWQFNDALFNWAKSLKPDELKELISNIINKYYAPSFEQLSTRHRKDPVINFLQSSMSERGDNRLAYILSAGNKDDGSLNRLLIEHLAPIMLQTCPIPSLNRDKDIFTRPESILFFTKATVHFAKTDERFSHLYSLKGQELAKKTEIGQFFCAAVFAWLDTLDRTVFYALIEGALLIYESGLSAFSGLKLWSGGGGSRRKEVEQYYKQYNQSGIVAAIFANGLSTSTLNEFLFKEIMKKMDQDLASNTEKRKLPMFQFINQFNALPYGSFYNELKEFAVGQTHKEVARKVASSSYSWF